MNIPEISNYLVPTRRDLWATLERVPRRTLYVQVPLAEKYRNLITVVSVGKEGHPPEAAPLEPFG